MLCFDTTKLDHKVGNSRLLIQPHVRMLVSSFLTTGIWKTGSPMTILVKKSDIQNPDEAAKSDDDPLVMIDWVDDIANGTRRVGCLAGQHREAAMNRFREQHLVREVARDKIAWIDAAAKLATAIEKELPESDVTRLREEEEMWRRLSDKSQEEHVDSYLWPVNIYDEGKRYQYSI